MKNNANKAKVAFLGPDPFFEVSGGNLYNRNLVTSLQNLNYLFDLIQPEFDLSHYDLLVVDSLNLNEARAISFDGPKILICHLLPSMMEKAPRETEKLKKIEQASLAIYKKILATGHFCYDYLINLGIDNNKLELIEPVLEVGFLESSGKKELIPPIKILIVANLLPNKGVAEFLKQVLCKASEFKNSVIKIASSSLLSEEYLNICVDFKNQLHSLGVWVEICIDVPRKRLENLYYWADVVVSASKMETFGMAVCEAVLLNRWVLALSKGNIENLIKDGKNGNLFIDMDGLVEKLAEYATNLRLIPEITYQIDEARFSKARFQSSINTLIENL